MQNNIIAVLEQREGSLKKVSFESASVAYDLAKRLGVNVQAIAVGSDISNLNEISKYGISEIKLLKNKELLNYSASGYADAIADYAKKAGAQLLIMGNTSLGKDLAPKIAVKLDGSCAMDCIKLDVQANEVIATRPIYAGKANIDVKLKSEVKVFTIRPNVFKAKLIEDIEPSIQEIEIENPNLKSRVVSFKKSEGKLDVAEADIIVSGGRGLKGPENFHLIEELAEALGAAVGASRAVVDAGWRSHGEQVGQTGKTVSPSLYIACGISGAIQHLAGMSSSKYIVAINKDKDAPIFSVADYGIAGDVFEILPILTEEIKKIKS
jgi:electron transfer flavoprotein alpha subunit